MSTVKDANINSSTKETEMKRRVIIFCAMTLFMLAGSSVQAWQPVGWVYHAGDYAYSTGESKWYYFNAADTQWRVNLTSGVWDELTDASGWNYHQWPYSYSSDTSDWYWFNTSDVQWCVGLTSAHWSVFGIPFGMVLIPAGSFSMGDSFTEGDSKERPVHTVDISAFYMDKYEVTKSKWDEVANWASAHGYDITAAEGAGKATNHPVYSVTWYECVKWCNARSEKEGRMASYTVGGSIYKTGVSVPDCNFTANGYRLSTEAEWEKAARGGLSSQRFPWGANSNHDHANYKANGSAYSYDISLYTNGTYHPGWDDNGMPYTSPVGEFASNGYGLYDMSGNLDEWCNDWYSSSYYGSSPGSNPYGPVSGSSRIARGCSWSSSAFFCRVASRGYYPPDSSSWCNGFRTCLSTGQ